MEEITSRIEDSDQNYNVDNEEIVPQRRNSKRLILPDLEDNSKSINDNVKNKKIPNRSRSKNRSKKENPEAPVKKEQNKELVTTRNPNSNNDDKHVDISTDSKLKDNEHDNKKSKKNGIKRIKDIETLAINHNTPKSNKDPIVPLKNVVKEVVDNEKTKSDLGETTLEIINETENEAQYENKKLKKRNRKKQKKHKKKLKKMQKFGRRISQNKKVNRFLSEKKTCILSNACQNKNLCSLASDCHPCNEGVLVRMKNEGKKKQKNNEGGTGRQIVFEEPIFEVNKEKDKGNNKDKDKDKDKGKGKNKDKSKKKDKDKENDTEKEKESNKDEEADINNDEDTAENNENEVNNDNVKPISIQAGEKGINIHVNFNMDMLSGLSGDSRNDETLLDVPIRKKSCCYCCCPQNNNNRNSGLNWLKNSEKPNDSNTFGNILCFIV